MKKSGIVVDASHWLKEDGSLPEEPPALRRMALRMIRCIEYGADLSVLQARETLVECRRRPQGRACLGLLWVVKTENQEIRAFCPVCRADEFFIHNWERTLWAEGLAEPVPVQEVPIH